MIYQIYYNEETKKNCMKGAKLIYNGHLHPSFENKVIADNALDINDEYFGILSHNFKKKHYLKKYTVDNILKEAEKVDVLSFFKHIKNKNQVNYLSVNQRFDFKKVLEVLLKGTGYEIPEKTPFTVYQNAFLCKKEIYHKYVREVLQPALKNSRLVWDELMSVSKYKGSDDAKIKLMKQYDVFLPTYPIFPFAFELLFSIFLANNNYDCKHF